MPLPALLLLAGSLAAADEDLACMHMQTSHAMRDDPAQPPPCISLSTRDVLRQQSVSQNAEEAYLLTTFFGDTFPHTYLEMGALDGKTFSNTALLESHFGWKGVLIEADPANFKNLQRNRPASTLVHMVACQEPRTVHWVHDGPQAVHGIWELMSDDFRALWHPNPQMHPMQCQRLGTILRDDLAISRVDFWSLDVEGAELEVLQSVDLLNDLTVRVLCVEMNPRFPAKNAQVRQLLQTKSHLTYFAADHANEWWVDKRPCC